jgi:hypothetical protein
MQLNLLDNSQFHILRSLEWETIISELSHFCHFEASREQFHEPILTKPYEEISLDYQSLNFFVQLSYQEDYFILKNDLANVLNKKILKYYLESLKKSAILE